MEERAGLEDFTQQRYLLTGGSRRAARDTALNARTSAVKGTSRQFVGVRLSTGNSASPPCGQSNRGVQEDAHTAKVEDVRSLQENTHDTRLSYLIVVPLSRRGVHHMACTPCLAARLSHERPTHAARKRVRLHPVAGIKCPSRKANESKTGGRRCARGTCAGGCERDRAGEGLLEAFEATSGAAAGAEAGTEA